MNYPEDYYPENFFELEECEFPRKGHHRADKRRKDEMKARHKERIANQIYPYGWNAPHGYYRKGKIHCSCPMCAAKTNAAIHKSRGPVSPFRNTCRWAVTNKRYGKKNWKASDMRQIDAMFDQFLEFRDFYHLSYEEYLKDICHEDYSSLEEYLEDSSFHQFLKNICDDNYLSSIY